MSTPRTEPRAVRILDVDLFATGLVDELNKPVPMADGASSGAPAKTESWIQVAKLGAFNGHAMGPFEFTHDVFEQIIANFARTSNRAVPVDFEHATEMPAYAGNIPSQGAPATGWIVELANRGAAGLWGRVEWLEPGLSYVRARRYKFFSPAVVFDYTDGVSGQSVGPVLVSGGLTNRPFLDGMAPVTASRAGASRQETTNMTIEQLLKALALAMGEKDAMSAEATIEKVTEMRVANTDFASTVKTMKADAEKRDKADAESEVDGLIRDGVFVASSREQLIEQRTSNVAGFRAIVKAMSAKGSKRAESTATGTGPEGKGAVTAGDEKALTERQTPTGGAVPERKIESAVALRYNDRVHEKAVALAAEKPADYRHKRGVPNQAAYEAADRAVRAELATAAKGSNA